MNKLIGRSNLKNINMTRICSGDLEIEIGNYNQPTAFLTIKQSDLGETQLTLADKYYLTYKSEARGIIHLRAKLMGFNEGERKDTIRLFFIKE